MDQQTLYDELVRVLAEAGVEVRTEPFERPSKNAGGLCRLQGRALVLLDAGASKPEQQRALIEAVESFGLSELGLRGVELSPPLLRALSRRGNLLWPRPHLARTRARRG